MQSPGEPSPWPQLFGTPLLAIVQRVGQTCLTATGNADLIPSEANRGLGSRGAWSISRVGRFGTRQHDETDEHSHFCINNALIVKMREPIKLS